MKKKIIQKGNETRAYVLNNHGVLVRYISIALQTLLLSYPDVTISTNASEETFEFFVNQAEKNNTLVKEQLDAVPSAMNLTIDTQFQKEEAFCDREFFFPKSTQSFPEAEEAAILRSSMDMQDPIKFDQDRFKDLLLKMLEKKGLTPRKGEDETQDH